MLHISIVLYRPDWRGEVLPLLQELLRATTVRRIFLVDNSPQQTDIQEYSEVCDERVTYVHNMENLGYGAAHNVALRESIAAQVPFHLVMNSDILVKAEDIDTLCQYMSTRPDVGQLMPHVVYPSGETQYLCKLLPTPWDVFGRRFLPVRWMAKRNNRYELRFTGYDKPMNVPYLSGCFMLLRTEAVKRVHLFDERYFMYPEDIDLTRRIHRYYVTLYYPEITIIHNHAQSSYKSLRMLWIHIINMCRYFCKWGWLFDAERQRVNRQTLSSL